MTALKYLARFLGIVCVTCALVYASLDTGRLAAVWILLSVAAGALALVLVIPRAWASYLGMTLLSLALTCAAVEFYYYKTGYNDAQVREGRYPVAPDAVLGYAPEARAGAHPSRVRVGDTVVYDVVYTTKADGWRVTPDHPDARNAVIFLGCSYTQGEGVNDTATYAWQVGELLGREWQVFNYGLSGYGPHHALALLQSGRLDPIFARYQRVQVFFLSIPGHELRVAGFSSWDRHGPRYVLEQGKAVRRGHFDTPRADAHTLSGWLAEQGERVLAVFRGTELCRQVILQILQLGHGTLIRRQCAVFAAMDAHIAARYPNARFAVLLYPSVKESDACAGVPVLKLAAAFPDWPDDAKYRIPLDRHPSPAAHARVARWLAEAIKGGASAPAEVQP